jgi:hypothetical protein
MHSHPAHRNRGTLSKAEYEAAQQEPTGPVTQEAEERSERWMNELDGNAESEYEATIRTLRAALERIDYYYKLNDGDDMNSADAIEIDVKALREIHNLLHTK